jgi:O-antigen/teichoic acid export membrane protein
MLKNGFYNTAAGAIRSGINVLTIPILIRALGVDEYGLWTLASTVINVVTLAEAGLSTATTMFVSQDLAKEDFDGVSQTLTVTGGAMLGLATLAALVLAIGAEPIVSSFAKLDRSQQLTAVHALQIGGIVVWTKLFQQVLIGIEQAYQRYDLLNLLNTIQSLLTGLGMLVVVWWGGQTIELMQCQAIIGVVILMGHIALVKFLTHNTKLRYQWDRSKGLTVARYSLQTWFTSLGGVLFAQADKLIVGAIFGSRELGIYAVITNIASQINLFSYLPVQPIVPKITQYFATPDAVGAAAHSEHRVAFDKQIKSALEINFSIALGAGAMLFTFAPLVLDILIHDATNATYILSLQIVAISYGFASVNAVGYYILLATDAVNICMKIQLISSVGSLLIIYIGSLQFGIIGAAVGNAGFMGTLLMVYMGMQKISIPMSHWFQWISFPVLWFVGTIAINSVVNGDLWLVLCACLEVGILCGWFSLNHRSALKHST